MPTITVIDRAGSSKSVEAATGVSLMEVIRDNGFDDDIEIRLANAAERPEGTAFFPQTPGMNTPFTPGTPGVAPELADPWRQLDPHESKASSARPFRRGKTYRSLEEV